jgi:large subunit ribosomal protein L13e
MHHIKPIIVKPNGKLKRGRGFSPNEIKEAGISKQKAQQMGLPIDMRRKTSHEKNVASIKEHLPQQKS